MQLRITETPESGTRGSSAPEHSLPSGDYPRADSIGGNGTTLPPDVNRPLISIVITSYDLRRLNDVEDAIASILNQTNLDGTEVVIVIERDIRLYEELRKSVPAELGRFGIHFYDTLGGLSGARNVGASIASGEHLAFIDDDVVLTSSWLVALKEMVSKRKDVMLTGPAKPLWKGSAPPWYVKELSWLVGSSEWFSCSVVTNVRNGWGNNIVVPRSLFQAVGGFSEEFGLHNSGRSRWSDPPSEDVDLSLRLGAMGIPVLYVPHMSVYHKATGHKLSPLFMAQRAFSLGHQRAAIERLNPGMSNPLSSEKGLVSQLVLVWAQQAKGVLRNPVAVFNRTSAIEFVTLMVALGYFIGTLAKGHA